jgi:hypothetical protein
MSDTICNMERGFGGGQPCGLAAAPHNTISHYKLSFWAAASALWALAAAVRARPPCGRARPSPLHIKKALASKWYNTISKDTDS